MRSLAFSALLLAVIACGSGAPEDIERICVALTECGTVSAADTDRCISELDGATPDSASRAATECADCVDTKTCGEVSSGACGPTCKPLGDTVNGVSGTVSGGCTSTTTANYAIKSAQGNLMINLACQADVVEITPGPFFDTVGTSKPCGKFFLIGNSCDAANGTVSISERDGRRWAKGTCSCLGLSVTFDVPFRLNFF